MEAKRVRKWCAILAAAAGCAALFGVGLWRGSPYYAGDFDFYEPPVLPMTAVSGGGALTAQRSVTLDFSGVVPGSVADPARVAVTDTYLLTNPTAEALTVELACPFYWQLYGGDGLVPALTVDGAAAEAELHASVDAGGSVRKAGNFQEFQAAMAETDFLAEALAPAPALNTPVKVYHITDFVWPEGEDPEDLRVGVIYSRPDSTTVWKYGTLDMTENETLGIDYMLLHAPTADAPWVMDEAYLIVEGPDVGNLAIQGYRGYEVTEEAMVEGVSATVETFDSTLGQMLHVLAEDYAQYTPYDADRRAARLPSRLLADGAAKRIADDGYATQAKTSLHSLSELFDAVETEERLAYAAFAVTIPAGETVTVQAQYAVEGSQDSPGLPIQPARNGFELAASLGSNLTFTSQSAALTGVDAIRPGSQNFGFDYKHGVTTVALDPETERYYLIFHAK